MADNEEQIPQEEVLEEARHSGAEAEVETESDDLTMRLEDARNKADEHWNELLRLRAEMENMRKRSERELANAHKYALEKFANELLAVRDSLEMGVAAAQDDHADVANLRQGSELTLKMLAQAMEKFGIQQINPEGEKFNPDQHQAISMVEAPGSEPNTVINVFQKGYQLNQRLIRPASVVLAKAGDPATDEEA